MLLHVLLCSQSTLSYRWVHLAAGSDPVLVTLPPQKSVLNPVELQPPKDTRLVFATTNWDFLLTTRQKKKEGFCACVQSETHQLYRSNLATFKKRNEGRSSFNLQQVTSIFLSSLMCFSLTWRHCWKKKILLLLQTTNLLFWVPFFLKCLQISLRSNTQQPNLATPHCVNNSFHHPAEGNSLNLRLIPSEVATQNSFFFPTSTCKRCFNLATVTLLCLPAKSNNLFYFPLTVSDGSICSSSLANSHSVNKNLSSAIMHQITSL